MFTVNKDETETFDITAKAKRAHYWWILEMDLVVNGHRKTHRIGDPSHPFETSSHSGKFTWEWNYRDAWGLTAKSMRPEDPLPARIPKKVPAGRPLPALP